MKIREIVKLIVKLIVKKSCENRQKIVNRETLIFFFAVFAKKTFNVSSLILELEAFYV